MKISYMLARENFYEIIEATVDQYNSVAANREMFYVFPHLNVIVKGFNNKKIRDYIRTEYSVKGSFIKRLLVKCYIEAVFKFPKVFKSCNIELCFNGNDRDDVLIYPCNHRVRVFYFDDEIVDVIVKDGFNSKSSQNEIEFRKKYPLDFVPSILNVNNTYYSEKIIDGTPLPRILDAELKNKTIKDVNQKILKFNYDNISYIKSNSYLKSLEGKILKIVDSFMDNYSSAKIRDFAKLINNRVNDFDINNVEFIPVVISHGDLQHGNVWLKKVDQQVVVFDWESADRRSIWYDLFFLETSRRGCIVINNEMLATTELYSKHSCNTPISVISNILTFENVHYYLTSLSNLPNNISKREIKRFVHDLDTHGDL